MEEDNLSAEAAKLRILKEHYVPLVELQMHKVKLIDEATFMENECVYSALYLQILYKIIYQFI